MKIPRVHELERLHQIQYHNFLQRHSEHFKVIYPVLGRAFSQHCFHLSVKVEETCAIELQGYFLPLQLLDVKLKKQNADEKVEAFEYIETGSEKDLGIVANIGEALHSSELCELSVLDLGEEDELHEK